MGLDITHDCWNGAYSAFMRWRQKLAEVAGLPPLDLMEGFYQGVPYWMERAPDWISHALPIRWEALKHRPLLELLSHSDCDGDIPWQSCEALAEDLQMLLPLLKGDGGGHVGDWQKKTQTFIDGLLSAAEAKENVEFR